VSPVFLDITQCSPLKVSCPAEYFTVQVYIAASQFSIVNENTKQISECLTRMETQKELIHTRAIQKVTSIYLGN
jgi:hypothetical protein